MPASPQDTGGLGLLQLLMQHGVPLQALLSLLLPQGQAPQAPPAEPPQPSGGQETPNIPDNETDAFGFGGATPGQIGSAAFSGARSGISGQLAESLDIPGSIGKGAAKAVGVGAKLAGVPGVVPSLIDILLGAAAKVAKQTLDLTGKQVAPMRFGGPKTVPLPPRAPMFDEPPPFGDPGNPGGGPSATPGTSLGLGLGPAGEPTFSTDLGLSAAAPGTQPDPTYGIEGVMAALADAIAEAEAGMNATPDAISNAIAEAGGANADSGPAGAVGESGSEGSSPG